MPTDYTCSACGLRISTGSYHGFGGAGWFNALYCRHCGTPYTLRQSSEQFFDGFGTKATERKTWEYEIRGPSAIQRVTAAEHLPVPKLKCEVCSAEGPFGPKGPITDEAPDGLASDCTFPFGHTDSDARGTCPKCKKLPMKVSGSWIT
jgi:hypothetical protein